MYSRVFTLMGLVALANAAPQSLANRETSSSGLSRTAQLTLADNTVDRYNLLKDEEFIFDFFAPNAPPVADRKTFPALVGTGVAVTVAEVPPCGMASVHIHPRASEIFIVTSGRLLTEMVTELGVFNANGDPRVIRTEIKSGQITVFPMGTLHGQMNPDCTPASLVAGFNSEDPGTALVALEFFNLSDEFVAHSLGDSINTSEVQKIRSAISKTFLFEIEECKKKCNL
ncbi:RmlC-like cupin domain-containing protein [Cladorrhinum sp. PSN332]|nr:RmlC-like cupin domain-containing protein [Cladorrhinum sp. PSN332]